MENQDEDGRRRIEGLLLGGSEPAASQVGTRAMRAMEMGAEVEVITR